jgi:hypothetical protein
MKLIDAKDFWQWAFSDFMSNALRGVLAEYIVASKINCANRPRTELVRILRARQCQGIEGARMVRIQTKKIATALRRAPCVRIFPFILLAIFISPVSRIEKIQSTIRLVYVKFSTL